MTKHIPHLMPYSVSVVVLTSMCAFLPTSSDALSYAPRAFSGDFSTQSYPKREASVFEIRGKRKIGLVLTTWPSLDGTVEFEESYYETGDLGATWRRVERSDVLDDPTEIGPHPADPRTIYRVHDAHDLTTFFLEKSSDDGKTWQKVDGRIRSTPEVLKSYSFLAFHPEDPATLYVSGPILGGDEATGPIGLYVSHDKGTTFSLLAANIDQLKFAISKSKPETIYACTFHQYLIKSDDGGRVWKFAGPCKQNNSECKTAKDSIEKRKEDERAGDHWIYDIEIDPRDYRTVYAQSDNGIWKTIDGGLQWCLLKPAPNAKVGSMVVAVNEREAAIFAGTEAGLFVSRDAGQSWSWVDLQAIGR